MPFRISLSRIPLLSCIASSVSQGPCDKASEALKLLEAFRNDGADVGRQLDAQRRMRTPPRQTLPVGDVRPTVIGLVIQVTDDFRDLPTSWDRTPPSHQTEMVKVGLIANTLEPARLEKLLNRIDLVRQMPDTEIGVKASPDCRLKELISVASWLRDTAKAGALLDDGKAAVVAACLDAAPSARFSDMDLAALCAYDFYCRARFPAASSSQSAIARAAQGHPGRRPGPVAESVPTPVEPTTTPGTTAAIAAMTTSRPSRRWRFRQDAPTSRTAAPAIPWPPAAKRAVQSR